MLRTLKRKCKFCGLRNVVEVLHSPQPNKDESDVEYVPFTRCSYCGANDA